MSTTHATSASLTTLSDLETRLFSARRSPAADALAFVAQLGPSGPLRAANVRAFLPDPPKAGRRAAVIESVLLRAA